MIVRKTWPHARIHLDAVVKLFLQAAYQINRITSFFYMSFCHVHVFGLKDVPARARRENGHDSPSPRSTVQKRPAVLSSGVGSDRTRSNRI